MAFHMQLRSGTFVPADALIPGNSESPTPCTFHISPASGPDKAKLKSLVVGTSGLVGIATWTPQVQDMVIKALQLGAGVFERTVDKVEGFTIPAAFAHRLKLAPPDELSKYADPVGEFPITTGWQFALVSGYHTVLSLAVAFEIQKLTGEADGIDYRFFLPLSGSSRTATPKKRSSTARSARKKHDGKGTAGSK